MSSLGYLNIQLSLDQAKFQENISRAQTKAKQFSERTTQYLNNIEKAAKSINRIYPSRCAVTVNSLWQYCPSLN